MKDYNTTEITNPVDDLFVSVNDIYEQYDEGRINYPEAEQILARICKHFLVQQPKPEPHLEHKIKFASAWDCSLWLSENDIELPVTLTLHLGE
jgi:hypothetical protein